LLLPSLALFSLWLGVSCLIDSGKEAFIWLPRQLSV
jgi:hypothetical protein